MSYLKVTLIDVGWGDSILLEASDDSDRPRFAIIDSNDNKDKEYWPTWNFLRKHFGSRESEFSVSKPFFDFVMLTHDHSDHGSGLKRIMRKYGARAFWYPKVDQKNSIVLSSLINYVNHSRVRMRNQAVRQGTVMENLGGAAITVLWPPPDTIDNNPNNNSIVLSLSLSGRAIMLTGDAEGPVWEQIAHRIPENTKVFKVPHHGSRNGTLHRTSAPWVERLDTFSEEARLGISCHPNFPNRYDFPHDDVIDRLELRPYPLYRTDLHYHITFTIDESGLHVKYSH